MDANGNYDHDRDADSDIHEFLWDVKLVDPYHDRFPRTIRMCAHRPK